MSNNDKLTEILNDLIEINIDRASGYQKAAEEMKTINGDLKAIFHWLAKGSSNNANELKQEVIKIGGETSAEMAARGDLYLKWMDVKIPFETNGLKSILESCELNEDATQEAYKEAIESGIEMDNDIRYLLADQQAVLKKSHDLIREYRDLAVKV